MSAKTVITAVLGLLVSGTIMLTCGITWVLFAFHLAKELMALFTVSPAAFLIVLILCSLFSFLGFFSLTNISWRNTKERKGGKKMILLDMILLKFIGFIVASCVITLCGLTWLVFGFNLAKSLVQTFWFNPVLFVLGLVAATIVSLFIWVFFYYELILKRETDSNEL